jgi:hypothetical protein
MLTNRFFRVFLNDRASRWRKFNNGLPQGSVLAPTLFNLYIYDFPTVQSKVFSFADDALLAIQTKSFEEAEKILSEDLLKSRKYFSDSGLKLNELKTEVSCFHLNNKEAHRELNVCLDDNRINHNFCPKYLGVDLDRTLTFKHFLEKRAQKIKTRNNLIQSLAGTSWGANANTLRTAALGLVWPTAEYCSPSWLNSSHISKIDVQLNNTMRLISGTLKCTQLKWLPVLSNIAPHHIRRKKALSNVISKSIRLDNSLLCDELKVVPPVRLKSRNPPWINYAEVENYNIKEAWIANWNTEPPVNEHLITDPTKSLSGDLLNRKIWTSINRFRTNTGRCNSLLHKWNMCPSPNCDCGALQTMDHIVNSCPLRKFPGGMTRLNNLNPDAIQWLESLDISV